MACQRQYQAVRIAQMLKIHPRGLRYMFYTQAENMYSGRANARPKPQNLVNRPGLVAAIIRAVAVIDSGMIYRS